MNRILYLTFIVLISCAFVACDGDGNFDDSIDNIENQNPSDDSDDSNEVDDIWDKIRNNTSVSAYYKDYACHISIYTTLEKIFPYRDIKYMFECGYGNYNYYCYLSNEKMPDGLQVHINTDRTKFDVIACIFIRGDGSPYETALLYYSTWLAINDKLAKGETLSESENDLYREVCRELQDAENDAKEDYQARIIVEVDDAQYTIATMSF